ncbi:hypothetical protein [Streptomyces sp. NPDC017673]|uniref:hypothetical protein n=1 Tax=unclassified Streptomyces TaxID=2593676 RepID=UPI00378B0733
MVSHVQVLSSAELSTLLAGFSIAPDVGPSALWLPAHPDNEAMLVAELSAAWRTFEWFALGTWYAPGSSSHGSSGFANRYPGMTREIIAESVMETPRGLKVRAEWSALNSESAEIKNFMASTRRAKGKGMCLALLPSGTSPRNWYALSMGMVGRAVLAVEAEGDVRLEELHRSATWQYLAGCAGVGCACIVPLDLHPWGGYVVIADNNQLMHLARQFRRRVRGLAQVGWEEVIRGGGGLAL